MPTGYSEEPQNQKQMTTLEKMEKTKVELIERLKDLEIAIEYAKANPGLESYKRFCSSY